VARQLILRNEGEGIPQSGYVVARYSATSVARRPNSSTLPGVSLRLSALRLDRLDCALRPNALNTAPLTDARLLLAAPATERTQILSRIRPDPHFSPAWG
jgi:hypothetical protein